MYQNVQSQGVTRQAGLEIVPEGGKLGLGVKLAGIRDVHIQGTLNLTGNPLDVALNGRGWLQVQGPTGDTLYTRAGALNLNQNGQLVNLNGYLVEPAITVPENSRQITISASGQVTALLDGDVVPTTLGQLTLSNFVNEAGLEPLGDNLFSATDASGSPVQGVAGDPNFGTIEQGYLESSNVDAIKEITAMIQAQRAYENELEGDTGCRRNVQHSKSESAMNFVTRILPGQFCLALVYCFLVSSPHASERVAIPVPKNVVYAGQIIDQRLLRDRSVPVDYLGRVSVFTTAADVVGKIAKTTLMPNRPIPTNYLDEPNVVEVNRKAIMRFEVGQLRITAEVIPLNAAKTGEPVRARNINTGIVVHGVANADGSISTLRVQ